MEVYGSFLNPYKDFIFFNKCLLNQSKLPEQQYLKKILSSSCRCVSSTVAAESPQTLRQTSHSEQPNPRVISAILFLSYLFVFALTSLNHCFLFLSVSKEVESEWCRQEWWIKYLKFCPHKSNENTGNNHQNQLFKNLKLTKDLQHLGEFIQEKD